MSIDPTNLSASAHLTFDDEFNSLSLWNGQSGTWATTYLFADPHGNGSSLPGNGEQEWYINSMYAPTAGVHPWTVSNGVLTLSAQPTDPSIAGQLGYSNGLGPGLGSYAYTSGLITSAHSFTQTYGYFEMSAKLPAGQGLWPAFWLLPANGNWPPELDAMEVLGKDPSTLYTSAHTAQTGSHVSQGLATNVGDTTNGFHTYGIDWEADKVTWYFDHHQVYQIDTPADMHSPMYMLANLAVGGPWAGNADGSTPFPAQMQIDYIRAYADGPGAATTPAWGSNAASTGAGSTSAASAGVSHTADISVANLSYEFFTGHAPTAAGMDYLVSPNGPNPDSLGSAYYQTFNLENRFINFAVDLGKLGAGAGQFAAEYGNVSLFDAAKTAYATIFGAAPSDATVNDILGATVQLGGASMTRADYFAQYGQDGINGLGTKAAMVGWLLAEAQKEDVGVYAHSNDAFLTDLGNNAAPYGVDIVGHYSQPGWIFHG